jgi:hypothetical protein
MRGGSGTSLLPPFQSPEGSPGSVSAGRFGLSRKGRPEDVGRPVRQARTKWRMRTRLRALVIGLGLVVATVLFCTCLTACGDPLNEAYAFEKAGDLEGAVQAYDKVRKDDPENVAALSGEAVCLLQLHRYDEALVLQERVVALDPTDALTRVELGFNYLNHQGRDGDAVNVFEEAVALEPSAKNLVFLAQAQEAAGDVGAAEASLRRAIETDSAYGRAYAQLVSLLERQHRREEAGNIEQLAHAQGVDLGAND